MKVSEEIVAGILVWVHPKYVKNLKPFDTYEPKNRQVIRVTKTGKNDFVTLECSGTVPLSEVFFTRDDCELSMQMSNVA